jgi:leishmanolysin
MARALPVGPELVVVNPAFSALAALGLEEAVVSMGPADVPGSVDTAELLAEPIPFVADLESTDSATVSNLAPIQALALAEVVEGAPDLTSLRHVEAADENISEVLSHSKMGLVMVPFDLGSDAQGWPVFAQGQAAPSFLDQKSFGEFRTEELPAAAVPAAEITPVDGFDAARPGGGGGVGGSGGDGGGSGVLTQYLSGSGNGTAGYDILIQFKGTGWTVDLQTAFKNAADYFTTVITGDIGGGGRIGKVIVDDLYVTAEVRTIDGVGNILGQAGPSHVWTANDLTADGSMQFDVADAQDFYNQGLWDDIVTHELMHVLGFGSLWNYGDHVGLVSGGQYTGFFALTAYKETHSGATSIPVEQDGGSGTAGSHWDEGSLSNELMTGYINSSNYLSKFSVMSLADLGYTVDYQPLIT